MARLIGFDAVGKPRLPKKGEPCLPNLVGFDAVRKLRLPFLGVRCARKSVRLKVVVSENAHSKLSHSLSTRLIFSLN